MDGFKLIFEFCALYVLIYDVTRPKWTESKKTLEDIIEQNDFLYLIYAFLFLIWLFIGLLSNIGLVFAVGVLVVVITNQFYDSTHRTRNIIAGIRNISLAAFSFVDSVFLHINLKQWLISLF